MEWLNEFHFLRPWWLVAILPIAWLCYRLWRHQQHHTGLEAHIAAPLLRHLTTGTQGQSSPLLALLLFIIGLIVCIALAGPTGKQRPQALYTSQSAVIILLDLSPSMRADDNKPSRITQAHVKIQDVLNQRQEGLTALIAYAGEAHIVTPMSDDTATISNLLPTLTPGILPIPGSNIEMAITLAKQVMQAANQPKASLLLVTDGIAPQAVPSIKRQLTPAMDLTILGVGTDAGAPIPYQGEFLKDQQGKTVIARRNSAQLKQIAAQVGGHYLPIQSDTGDTDFFLKHLQQRFDPSVQQTESERQSDQWYELGPTLLLFALPLVALLFRKGWLFNILLVGIGFTTVMPMPAHADWWDSLWKNGNQQGTESFDRGEYQAAEKQFKHPQWKGSAHYKNGDYQDALPYFEQDTSATGDYNRGNTLAQLQRYDEAIAAYNAALEKNPEFEAARNNKALIEALQQQQKQQEQKQEQQQQKQQQQQEKQQTEQNQQQNDSADSSQQSSQDTTPNNQKNQKDTDSEPQSTPNQQSNASNTDTKESNESEDKQANKQSSTDTKEQTGDEPATNSENMDSENMDSENIDSENMESESPEIKEKPLPMDSLSTEQQQALQQWLRKVPDNPSGLLKEKFKYEFQKRKQLYQRGEWELPKNDAHQRY